MITRFPADIFLHPGDLHFGKAPMRISTLLGSCVSITVWHPEKHVGGMCHILLPERKRSSPALRDARYANEAVELLVDELKLRGISPSTCQVKLFGGSNMFAANAKVTMDVGKRNVEAARHALACHGFSVLSEHVGGAAGRRLYFDLLGGHVLLSVFTDKRSVKRETACNER